MKFLNKLFSREILDVPISSKTYIIILLQHFCLQIPENACVANCCNFFQKKSSCQKFKIIYKITKLQNWTESFQFTTGNNIVVIILGKRLKRIKFLEYTSSFRHNRIYIYCFISDFWSIAYIETFVDGILYILLCFFP